MDNVLIITGQADDNLFLSARNLPNVLVLEVSHADPVNLVRYSKVLMTRDAVKKMEEVLV
jgi:large subunit ribosomal protein L4